MKPLLGLLALCLLSTPALPADLLSVYRDALQQDPTFAAAQATAEAGQEKSAQGLATLLPSLSASGHSTRNEVTMAGAERKYTTDNRQITLSQPIFRVQNWLTYRQGRDQATQASLSLEQAHQDLILRVAQAYFDVLYARENLTAVRASKTAIAQQLALAKASFEVGTATITDTHEAQARFDLATAQEIAAESDLEVRERNLQNLIGKVPGPLAAPGDTLPLSPPQPADLNHWIAAAEANNPTVRIQSLAASIADSEASKQAAGHLPTVDLVANQGRGTTFNTFSGTSVDSEFVNAGIQVNIPLFAGGSTLSRQREASANRRAAEAALEAARRSAALAVRQHYLGVSNGIAQVRALQAALVSSRSALESNQLGYEVGVRINIDVLNAENQVYVTRRDLARANFDTLMAQLRLQATVGRLDEAELARINALLLPAPQ